MPVYERSTISSSIDINWEKYPQICAGEMFPPALYTVCLASPKLESIDRFDCRFHDQHIKISKGVLFSFQKEMVHCPVLSKRGTLVSLAVA